MRQRGIALILVTFIVALITIIVIHFTQVTYLSSRSNAHLQRSVEAEYLLKSLVSVAKSLIKNDKDPVIMPKEDIWYQFFDGQTVDGSILGAEGAQLSLQIRPWDEKIDLRTVVSPTHTVGSTEKDWIQVAQRLFMYLGFDSDGEEDHTGLFPGKIFDSHEMVANLVDYMDRDPSGKETTFQDGLFQGIEESVKEGIFPNERLRKLSELILVPGFTPNRLIKLMSFIREPVDTAGYYINVNVAPSEVLQALHQDVLPADAERIISERQAEPFTEADMRVRIDRLLSAGSAVGGFLVPAAKVFEVVARVEFGSGSYISRAFLDSGGAYGSAKDFPRELRYEVY